MSDEEVSERRVDEAGGIELLAGDGCTDDGEDSRADDCADAQRCERPGTKRLFEPVLRVFRVQNQLIDRLARE